ncbi:MAG: 2-dehydropantoate 2-reductase [Rhodospirillaceae bacterium]|nr:2-dehydropantoate 2-reductase [Rhodospirillaceae bacterium]MBT6135852.1 2-dehydropantoate 2-reductase [Rhodospirillaceae bacterium]
MSMRIAVMGSGGIGGYYGANLAKAGHEVAFVARGAHLEAIRAGGFHLTGPRGDIHLNPVLASDDPVDIGPVDVILFCVKLYDTEDAANSIRPMVGPETMVISLMNGVDGPDRISAVIGERHVLGGAAYVSAVIEKPGQISYREGMNSIVFGEHGGGKSARAEAFAEICREAGFEATVSDDIGRDLWVKFLLLATNAGLTAITRKPAGEVYSDPDLKALAIELMREVAAIATAKGIALPDGVVENAVRITEGFPPGLYASMYYDLDRGKRMELESFSGLVVRLGTEFGIPTPHHSTIYACLKPYMNGSAT